MVKKNIRKDKNNFLESLNLFNNSKSAKKSYNGILIIAGILGVLVLSGLVVSWSGDAVDSGHRIKDAIQLLNSTNERYNASFTNPNFTFNEGTSSVLRFNISSLGLPTAPSKNITAINVSFDKTFVITNYTFNMSMQNGSSNIFSTFNLTGINDSSPPVYFFNKPYDNGTINGTLLLLHVNRTLTDNRSIFHWLNMSDDYGLLGNGTKNNVPGNNQSFYFSFFEDVPGDYNITVLLENDTGAAGATRASALFRIRINDTTAPDKVLLNQNSTGANSITPIYSAATIPATTSKVNLSSKSEAVTLYISVNAADFNESLDAGRIAYAGQAILNANISVYNWTGGAGVMNSSLINRGSGTNNATLDINFSAMMGGILNLTDGDYLIVVRNVTDVGSNRNFTSMAYNVTIDGTNPSVTVAKDATSTAHQIVLAITVSDATSGINGKQCTTSGGGVDGITLSGVTGSQTATQAGLGCNTAYTYTVACTDHAGNTNSQSVTVNTDGCTGGGGTSSGTSGGSGSDVVGSASSAFWVLTYNEASTELSDDSDGVSSNLAERYRVKVKVDTKLYYVGVVETTDTTAKINITTTASDKEATFSVGDVKKFDVNADDKYDLSITLNGIDSATGKADLSVIYIQEPVPAEEQAGVEEQAGTEAAPTTGKSKAWIWIVVVLIVIAIAAAVFFGKRKSRFKNYGF